MRELRTLVALALAGAGWWIAMLVPAHYDVGGWYVAVAIIAFLVGPFAAGLIASLPHVRGREVKLPAAVAGAGGPVLLWLVAIDWETSDGTPAKLLAMPVFVALALLGALLGWALAATLEAVQGDASTHRLA